ncbi:hypothetical protein N8I77_004789 [Diaporthe amygdali]|uniref:Rhodopsin domain-containing protein n=1 Tax=Phomopsis amygdali TaxID=1214568 RepID=A0AAD9SMS1_PHOAM|nr:hypothetical protein N8I77_004789 [Diaporthe amygdali]
MTMSLFGTRLFDDHGLLKVPHANWPRDVDVAFENEDLGPTIVSISVAVYSCCTIFVLTRILLRLRLLTKPSSDDYLTVMALVFGWIGAAFAVVAVQHGLGRHVARLPPAKAHRVVLWSMIGFCFTLLSIALPKVAVVALLIRLMSPSSTHRYLLWFLAGLCSLVLLGHVPIIWTLCNTNSGCWNANIFLAYSTFAGTYSAFVDIYLSVYPAVVLFKLKMKREKKVGISLALGIGSLRFIDAHDMGKHRGKYGNHCCMYSRAPTPARLIHSDLGPKEATASTTVPTIPPYHYKVEIIRQDQRKSLNTWAIPCNLFQPSVGNRAESAQSSATEQNRANSDWRRLDNDADAASDAQPGFEQCFGLTDMEEDKLMIWNYGRLSVAPRYEEVIIPIDDASPNLPGIPAHVHTRRVYPETYP